ncbi:MAG: hypothetical protein GX410_07585, partial [Elusimicrobia bacterium]|nr:hypothetical protein [Elusimicrobiota bacterium]
LRSDIRKTVLRAPIVYGPHDSGAYLIAKWVKSGLMLNPGGGAAHFSFIFIDDLSAALHRAVCDASLPGLYYVSENRSYQWRQYVLELAKAMRCKPPLMISVPALPLSIAGFLSEKGAALLGKTALFNRDKARESLAGHWICSPAKWEKAAGFASWTPLERGLAATFGSNH